MATSDVLDRLEALLEQGGTECVVALRNAAPALIRLARAAMAMAPHFQSYEECDDEGCASGFDHEVRKVADEAIKALGEVRL